MWVVGVMKSFSPAVGAVQLEVRFSMSVYSAYVSTHIESGPEDQTLRPQLSSKRHRSSFVS
jgi:hypothetical protein